LDETLPLFLQAIQAVRNHELRAYIVYVKPPSQERLKETRRDSLITTSCYASRPFKVKAYVFFCPMSAFLTSG